MNLRTLRGLAPRTVIRPALLAIGAIAAAALAATAISAPPRVVDHGVHLGPVADDYLPIAAAPAVPSEPAPGSRASTGSFASQCGRNLVAQIQKRMDVPFLEWAMAGRPHVLRPYPHAPVNPQSVQKSHPSLRMSALFPHSGHFLPGSVLNARFACSVSGTSRIPTAATG